MADYGFVGFEKAFNKAVPSYDETKYYFIPKKKKCEGTVLHFVCGGKVYRINMYLCDFEIKQWAGHMEEFCKTGEFDFNTYHTVYKSETVGKEVRSYTYDSTHHKTPMKIGRNNELSAHSAEFHEFMKEYREKNGDCGFTQVGKNI